MPNQPRDSHYATSIRAGSKAEALLSASAIKYSSREGEQVNRGRRCVHDCPLRSQALPREHTSVPLFTRSAFANKAAAAYTTFTDEELRRFCHTIAFLWQVHPFYEGNTRTIAVFSELYLNSLGFQVANDPFAKHARYFRDALVRAQYRNAAAKIFPDDSFLMRFYKNVIGEDGGELNRTEMICARLFEDPTLLRNVDPKDALRKAEGERR